ncbi:hypothetical protein [Paraburkholderia sp. BL6669N2]|uniref:hypothetical protein n=1 Tax=Paraburkholderia sp. BL6669N2 TaxID=1938807 RepID=UPI0015F29BE5|nr:hypothetical protein [Paraburkholderia sp. BL6669N2]
MRQTVLGVFDSYSDARSAQRTLGGAGVAQADISTYSMSVDAPAEKGHVSMHRPMAICAVTTRYSINSSNCSRGSQQVDTMTHEGPVASTTRSSDITKSPAVQRDASQVPAAPGSLVNDESTAGGTVTRTTAFSSTEPKMAAGMQQVMTHTEGLQPTEAVGNRQQLSDVSDARLTRALSS